MEQLEKDTKLLADHMVMDYSFLVGVKQNRQVPHEKEQHSTLFPISISLLPLASSKKAQSLDLSSKQQQQQQQQQQWSTSNSPLEQSYSTTDESVSRNALFNSNSEQLNSKLNRNDNNCKEEHNKNIIPNSSDDKNDSKHCEIATIVDHVRKSSSGTSHFFQRHSESTQHSVTSMFKQDEGGFSSEDRKELYYFSIVDIFQEWNAKKKVEHSLKSLIHESNSISAVEPSLYRERFLKFLYAIIE